MSVFPLFLYLLTDIKVSSQMLVRWVCLESRWSSKGAQEFNSLAHRYEIQLVEGSQMLVCWDRFENGWP